MGDDDWIYWVIGVFVFLVVVAVIIIVVFVVIEGERLNKPCTSTADCASGFFCVSNKCKAGAGTICDTSEDCATGLVCGPDFTCVAATGPIVLACTPGSCPSGTKCNTSSGLCLKEIGQPCKLASDCFYQPAVCTNLSTTAAVTAGNVCLIAAGGKCVNGTGCGPGLVCVTGANDPTGTCMASSSSSLGGGVPTSGPIGRTLTSVPAPARCNIGRSTFCPSQMVLNSDFAPTPRTNSTFNVESVPTRAERVDNFCTPPSGDVEVPFKKIRKGVIMSRDDTKRSPAIDATSYSKDKLTLMRDGMIIREREDKRAELIANNIRLKRLESFNGTLYGISVEGRVFSLNNDTYGTKKWMWTLTSLPTGVTHTSATLNGKHFWVQTSESGLLYDRRFRVVDRASAKNRKRVYGNDKDIYIEIDTERNVGLLQPNGTRVPDVASAVITHDNQLKVLRPSQTALISDIRLIHWTPAYIRKILP